MGRRTDLSTIFTVFPQSSMIPSFDKLVDLGRFRLHEQLNRRGIAASPDLEVILRKGQSHQLLSLDLHSPLIWNDDEYAWFYIPEVAGGADAYCEKIDEFWVGYWAEIVDSHEKARSRRSLIEACLSNEYYWSFRRSSEQPAIITFAYGILAASLAELTGGIIFSDDGAMEYERFPATAAELYELYFVPSKALTPAEADWARECLEMIPDELRG
jgi:hypothetical protein